MASHHSSAKLFAVLLLSALIVSVHSWSLTTEWSGNNFFNNFWFWDEYANGPDPTHGYVYYAGQQQAWDWGYVKVNSDNTVYIGCDSWDVSSGAGRGSVRLTSYQSWNYGLFIADIAHMPQGCGTWPAWWLVGPNWPNNGEIDIVEGVNTQVQDKSTLHTSSGCYMPGDHSYYGWEDSYNCAVNNTSNEGCGIWSPSNTSFGSGFNSVGGGVFACQWVDSSISIWYFPRNNIPQDILNNQANPLTWPMPFANFPLNDWNCPSSHFNSLNMVIDLTFCGDWAGSTFSSQCSWYGDNCDSFVQYNPSYFSQAYWIFNKIQVYQ